MEVKGKHVLVTGASRGIGLAMAKSFANKGAHVHLLMRTAKPELEQQVLEEGAASVRIWTADLGTLQNCRGFHKQWQDSGIELDVLVNNAGLLTGGLIEEQDLEHIESMLSVNLGATIYLTRLFLPAMLKRNSGKIVNNASVSGVMNIPCASTYSASKTGVVAFTNCIRQELKGTGVSTLILITPGVKTDMYDEISDLYGGHLDLKGMQSIPAKEWADKVVRSVEDDSDECKPSGSQRVGLEMAKYTPWLFERGLASKFQR